MIAGKFGSFSVQSKTQNKPKGDNKRLNNSKLVSGILIDFLTIRLGLDSTLIKVEPESQSVKGLKKFYRAMRDSFVVEKPLNSPRMNLPNCYKYRKGAEVKGKIIEDKDGNKLFYIKGYLNV